MKQRARVAVVGASGYAGGELLRLLLQHPYVEVAQVTSQRFVGRYVHTVHPNLRKRTLLQFVRLEDLEPCDILFTSLPHGESSKIAEKLFALAPRVVDLSADYRLRDPEMYPVWYGWSHPDSKRLSSFVYGLPELHRLELRGATKISGSGCLATAAIIALAPLFAAGLVKTEPVIIEGKFGSSAGGAEPSPASHHPERTSVIRTYEPVGHRHTAEIEQELALVGGVRPKVHLTATSVDSVRGVQTCCHVFLKDPAVTEQDIWKVYREAYSSEPFVRLVKERHGIHRVPDPKVLTGSNYCDVGFARDPHSERLVVISAIDNLMKGAAGNAVQATNIAMGWPETVALDFAGLHPC
ncbi:MAG TPA: N-acetyl-gamma-glutamyl-phosphate reductase [Firmicutes bacterium]|nr:N-acetyl-gamma-glutamyl-phosphate reductase [Bacillota bacterium]